MLPRNRADHVGSFLRPPELLQARERFFAGELALERLREQEDAAILGVLRLQNEVGVSLYSDGELRRETWMTGFNDAVDSLAEVESRWDNPAVWHDLEGHAVEAVCADRAVVAVSELGPTRRVTEIETRFLQTHAPGTFKITVPSPVVTAVFLWRDEVTGRAYETRDEFLAATTEIMRQELAWLSEQHVGYIQMDEGFTRMVSSKWWDQVRARGGDPEAELEAAIGAENACYATVDRSRTVLAMQLCRGNSRSRWAFSGGYDAIAERVFNELDVDRFLLEYDSERAGTLKPLRFLPPGKVAVLGLITTKVGRLESEDAVLRRIEEASRYAPVDRLALSPQCGFASVTAGNLISFGDQRRKLELVNQVATQVWDDA
jgi:5-methyltetrahydropteroyltriglutamate--homocysteine methyltransferase